jgi:hypothetical protein
MLERKNFMYLVAKFLTCPKNLIIFIAVKLQVITWLIFALIFSSACLENIHFYQNLLVVSHMNIKHCLSYK